LITWTRIRHAPKNRIVSLVLINWWVDQPGTNSYHSWMCTMGYNQIPMFKGDWDKTTLTEHASYRYNVKLFGLKNVGVTYKCEQNLQRWYKRYVGGIHGQYDSQILIGRPPQDSHIQWDREFKMWIEIKNLELTHLNDIYSQKIKVTQGLIFEYDLTQNLG
jgi:hypothetical protein